MSFQTTGIGAGKAANIKNCELCARKIAEVADTPKVVVEKSTVPVRTAEAVRRVLATNDKGVKFQVGTEAFLPRTLTLERLHKRAVLTNSRLFSPTHRPDSSDPRSHNDTPTRG